jgi:hypothetical protein
LRQDREPHDRDQARVERHIEETASALEQGN